MNHPWGYLKGFGSRFLDLVYPRSCAGCGKRLGSDARYVCWDCLTGFRFVAPPYCAWCGDPVEGRIDADFTCYNCAEQSPHFKVARSAARYDGVLKEMLRRFKYGQALWLEKDLVGLLHTCVETHFGDVRFDQVTAVPLYPAKRRERGYNQAELLGRALARRLRAPFALDHLVRVRKTPSQTNLTARQRMNNVRDAFKVRSVKGVQGKRILLIDDVMTTGATVNECSRALKNAGSLEVYVATVARG